MLTEIRVSTSRKQEFIDITDKVRTIVKNSNIKEGLCILYVPHATAAITINENADPNIQQDIIKVIDKIVPEHNNYLHDYIDNNAAAHIKSSIIGVSEVIPITNNELALGTWQNIFLCEFDGPRTRRILIKIIKNAM